MTRRFILSRYFRRIGKLGGQARAAKAREPYRAKARLLREQLGLPEDRRLGNA